MTTYGQGEVGPGGLTYGDRIQKLRGRLDNPGANKAKLRGRIQGLRSQRYLQRDKNKPDPSLPFNAEYETTVSGLNRDRDLQLSNTAYQRQQVQSNYGFDNPLANPYSKAAVLQRSYDQANTGTVNSAAASGQLYSGATQTSLDDVLFNFGQQYNASRLDYDNQLRALTDQDVATQNAYGDSLQAAEAKRLADALATDVDPNAAPDRPGSVKKWVKGQRKDIRQLQKQGRDNQADKLRARLRKLGVGSGR